MKKLLLLMLSFLIVTGCGKVNEEKIVDNFINDVESSKSYKVESTMEIYSNEDTFKYKLTIYYMDDDYFKVDMLNTINNHQQILLRDEEAVYVVTPSLNKSYKFISDWPYNSSQAYILNSLIKDLANEVELKKVDDGYEVKTSVDYPNNSELSYEILKFDKNQKLKTVEVYTKDDILSIKVTYNKIDYKANLSDDDFDIDELMEENCCNIEESTEETSSLKDIIYPLYIPSNTYLNSKEIIDIESGERVILTFNGDKNFVLIEETAVVSNEFETIPVYGDPLMLSTSIGALSSNSLSWTTDNVNYYLTSIDLSQEELLTIADSLNNTTYIGK